MFIDSPFLEKVPDFTSYSLVLSDEFPVITSGPELNDETLALTLKTLGDETCYKVLIELIQPHAKNKDIAKNWGL